MHPIQAILAERRNGASSGIISYCTANEIVVEAAAEDAAARGRPLLVEATANQVNQFGGYTGMNPADFARNMHVIAERAGLPPERLILGGDHLGPLLWQAEPEDAAMDKAETLVREYVKAGFTKIHLDTSMRVGGDNADAPLAVETVARRGARLARAAMEELEKSDGAASIVFVVGSEVPVPGGTQHDEDAIVVTSTPDFENTVEEYRRVFQEEGLSRAWESVVGVVVQPGVEFSDTNVFQYGREAAASLMSSLKSHPNLVFEGHSTDYQTASSLRSMVRDGVAIMKVGPELTFSLREGLFALDAMERELLPAHKRANFRTILEEVMLKNPVYWEKYYRGDHSEKLLARYYSFSDRCRYYFSSPEIREAMERLFRNFDLLRPSLNVVHQFLPAASEAFMGRDYPTGRQLIKEHLKRGVLEKFQSAIVA